MILWRDEGLPWVFNPTTQEDYWRSRATYANIEAVMQGMRMTAEIEKIDSISMPRVGAGYGGLSWKKCCAIVEQAFDSWSGTLFIYDEYQSEA